MPRGQSSQGFTDGTITIGTNVDTAGINSGLARISKSFRRFNAVLGGSLGIQGLVRLGSAAIDAASKLQEVQNIVDVTFGDLEYKMEAFADTAIEAYGMSEFTAKQTAGSFMAMGRASGIAAEDAANMALQLTALAGDMASFYNIDQNYAKVALSAVYTGETETLKRYGIILTEANLQEYAHTRGIETKVKAMDASSKALLRYQYILEQTEYVQGDFLRTQDNWANQVRVLEERWNQFLITVGSGLITVFAPVVKMLNLLLQYLTQWVNAVGQILAKLLGIQWQDFESEMAQLSDSTDTLAESEDALGDSIADTTKKAKKALLPFDELNVLARKTADSAGGMADSLGIAIPDFETAFDVEGGGFEIELPDIDDWYEFGKYLSDTLASILDRIDWDSVYEHVKNFGKNLADFLNGTLQPENFAKIGETLAGILNTLAYEVLSFSENFDWENFGTSLSAGLVSFLENTDWTAVADAIDAFVQGLWTAIKTFIKENDNSDAVKGALQEFFNALDTETIEIVLGYLVLKQIKKFIISGAVLDMIKKSLEKGILHSLGQGFSNLGKSLILKLFSKKAVTSAVAGEDPFLVAISQSLRTSTPAIAQQSANLGLTIAQGIFGAVAAFFGGTMTGTGLGFTLTSLFGGDSSAYEDYLGLEGVLPLWRDFGKAIADVATDGELFKDTFKSMFEDTGFAKLLPTIITWFEDIGYAISHIFEDAKLAVQTAWETLATWFDTNVIQPVLSVWNNFSVAWTTFWSWVGSIFESIWIIIKAVWILAADWFDTNVIQPICVFFEAAWIVITSVWSSIWDTIKSVWNTVATWFDNNVIKPIQAFFEAAKIVITAVWTNIWEDIKSVWNTVSSWFDTNVIKPIQAFFESAKIVITAVWTNIWDDIKAVWVGVATWFDTNVIQPIIGFFNGLWENIVNGVKDSINTGIYVIESFINFIIDAINKFTSGLSSIASVASMVTGDSYTSIAQIPHVELPRLAQGAVIPPNNEFMAILGDQRRGTNIEAPLDTIVQAFKMALNENDSNIITQYMAQQVQLLEIIADKEFGISDKQIFNSVKRSAAQYTTMTGENAF